MESKENAAQVHDDEPVEALLRDPFGFIQERFRTALTEERAPRDGDWGIREVAHRLTADAIKFNSLPEINASGGIETIRENVLVRFRGLVQDMYEPEYYVGAYEMDEKNKGAGGTWITTKFKESIDVRGEIRDTVLFERRVLYCVPVPGEQPWVGAQVNNRGDSAAHLISGNSGTKRVREMDSMETCEASPPVPAEVKAMLIRPDIERIKKANAGEHIAPDTPEQIGDGEVQEESIEQLLNFPLVPETRSPCIVKLYGEMDDNLKLNDVVEFVGMLYYAPELGIEKRDQEMQHDNADAFATSSFSEEASSRNPVTSLVPRFHALSYKVVSQNTFVDSTPTERFDDGFEKVRDISLEQAQRARTKLLEMISGALGGDSFAAELVLMTLISRVHTRTDLLTLGKFSLNLSGCKMDSNEQNTVSGALSAVIGKICPSLAHLPLSVPSLNARSWTPKKDYVYNRLRSGPLQLAASTILLLDETMLEAGTLTQIGIRNVESLKSLSTLQDLEYDFQYHQMRIPVDIPLIVLSDTKSIIPVDVSITLRRTSAPVIVDVSDDDLKLIRSFVVGARMTAHKISDDASADIEAEIITARKNDKCLTQDVLHLMLTMARLHALSSGEKEITKRRWIEMVEMNRLIAERARVM